MERLTAQDIHTTEGLGDWRVLLNTLQAYFSTGSFSGATDFASRIGQVADEADHHPDLDVRYGKVLVRLTTHSEGALTTKDVDLARQISAIAAELGHTAKPERVSALEVAIDAMDIAAVRPFWKAVLGYRDEKGEDPPNGLEDPYGRNPGFWFQQMDEARPERNRIHIDVDVPHDQAEARVQAALDAGGTLVSDARARAFWVLADAEGNEACICTWQDRGA